MKIPFVGGTYKSRSPYWDGQECVNLFLEMGGEGSKTPAALLGTPGLTALGMLRELGGEVRGMIEANGYLYAACASNLYRVTPAGAVYDLGAGSSYTGPVSLADSGVELCLVDDSGACYVHTYATGVTVRVTDPDFPGSVRVAYLDGRFLHITPDSQQFFCSDLFNGSSFNGLAFASAESQPDKLVSLIVDHREVWLLGARTVEVWFNSGAADFPYERRDGAYLEIGCGARNSVAKLDNTVFWLSDRGTIVRAAGYTPQIISTRAIEYQISTYAVTDDAVAWAYTHEGHAYYVLTFPAAGATWVYDASTGYWHQRESWGLNRWRANCHAEFAGMHLVGDVANSKIYYLNMDAYTEDGARIRRTRVCPIMTNDGARVRMDSLTVDFQPGVGLPAGSGQGEDPQAVLDWSDDGGQTWSNQYSASLGKLGQYITRVIWRRLGMFRNRVLRLTITDPVKVVITGAYAQITGGRS